MCKTRVLFVQIYAHFRLTDSIQTVGYKLNYFGRTPLHSRWSFRGSGCPPLRFASAPRAASYGRLATIPHVLLLRLSESVDTDRQRAAQGREEAQHVPTQTHRPRRPWLCCGGHAALRSLSRSVPLLSRSLRLQAPFAPPGPALSRPTISCCSAPLKHPPARRPASLWSAIRRYRKPAAPACPALPLPSDRLHYAPAPLCYACASFHRLPVATALCQPLADPSYHSHFRHCRHHRRRSG